MIPEREFLEIFDLNGNYLGLLERSDCHKNPNVAHKAVHVLVFNSRLELILQKRSDKKELYPNYWDTSVGGHLMPGETYFEAGIRECMEELGFKPERLDFLYSYIAKLPHETELVETYYTIFDGPYNFHNSSEVSEIKAFPLKELFEMEDTSKFSPFFLLELRELKKYYEGTGGIK
ncbi:MAG: NUDIX domain-containing protein [Proteobacteria bacterium]|nr:NUDIX domain-containing protein [Pseudomonadota bacterium]